MSAVDLWGDLPISVETRVPVAVFAEQAALLGPKTGNLLEGRVHSGRTEAGRFLHDLDIVVPVLDNYVYTIARMNHGVELYPLNLKAGEASFWDEISTEDELVQALRRILTSDKVRRVIASLCAQASMQSVGS